MLSLLASAALLAHEPDGIGFIGLVPKEEDWTYATAANASKVYQLEAVDPGFDWNELVISWNVDGPEGVAFEAKAKVLADDTSSGMFSFGRWALGKGVRRESIKDQNNEWGKMDTDTLILKKLARKVPLQLILTLPSKDVRARVKFLGMTFRDSSTQPATEEPNKEAWGKTIEVPQRSQMSYEGGNVWCSPTSVSMLLSHWANQLNRPDLDRDVPIVAENVMDPNWPGTGNWPFNMAYAGSFEGIRAYVARFGGIPEIEDWIAEGIPVATSVSSAMLKGAPEKKPNDGHLVIVVGFTLEGDPIFNDPGRSKEVRQIYKRSDFERAWKVSGNTVYLLYPESMKPPKNRLGHWAD
jgi:hypothetical protein